MTMTREDTRDSEKSGGSKEVREEVGKD